MKKVHNHLQTKPRKSLPLSAIILVTLLLSTFLTVLVAEQQQVIRSKAQTPGPIQQACLPGTNLTKDAAGTLAPLCEVAPDAETCKDFCKRTEITGAASDSALCKPGGVYHCETGAQQASASGTMKGKCQQGACTTTPRTGLNSYCGGGGTCCELPKPLGGACTKTPDCETGLECSANKCSRPINGQCAKGDDCVQGLTCAAGKCAPKGPATDVDGDGIPNAQDPDIDGDGIPNAQDPDIDGDGMPNAQDQQPNGAPPPPPAAAPGGGGAPAPRGGGGAPAPGAPKTPAGTYPPSNSNNGCTPGGKVPPLKCGVANGYTCKNGFCMKTPIAAPASCTVVGCPPGNICTRAGVSNDYVCVPQAKKGSGAACSKPSDCVSNRCIPIPISGGAVCG